MGIYSNNDSDWRKIMVKKANNTYNFKYSFPNVVQLLDNRKITWKLVY